MIRIDRNGMKLRSYCEPTDTGPGPTQVECKHEEVSDTPAWRDGPPMYYCQTCLLPFVEDKPIHVNGKSGDAADNA